MSNGTKRQKNKKNWSRPKAGEIGYKISAKPIKKRKEENKNQLKLL